MIKTKKIKTTKKEFELFKKECQKWINIIGLHDWKIWYEHGDTDENSVAEYVVSHNGRCCTIYFTGDTIDKLSSDEIKCAAFHEILEIYMVDLRKMAIESYSYTKVDEATHRIVRMLENILLPKY